MTLKKIALCTILGLPLVLLLGFLIKEITATGNICDVNGWLMSDCIKDKDTLNGLVCGGMSFAGKYTCIGEIK